MVSIFFSFANTTSLFASELSLKQHRIYPDWLGLTEVKSNNLDRFEESRYQQAELEMASGRVGFYLGLGSLVASFLFDKFEMKPERTFSYMLVGGGWSYWLGSLGKTSNILSFQNQTSNEALSMVQDEVLSQEIFGASTQGAIGESSGLFLIPNGVYFHPLYNDVNGSTDKLLTASAKIGLLQTFSSLNIESVAYWRFLTPSFKPEFNVPDLPKPIGRFADWTELKNSVAREYKIADVGVRGQFTVGFNDIGNKGGREVHRGIHQITRNTLEHLEYTDQPSGRFLTVGGEVGVKGKICYASFPCVNQLFSFVGETSKMMREAGLQYNSKVIVVPKWWEQAVEIRSIRQYSSEVYEEIKPWRYEAAIGVRILENFTPTVKYVSSYLVGDDIGQTYFDLLHYNFEF